MSVEINGDFGNLPVNYAVTNTGKKSAWTSRLKSCMDDDYTVNSKVLAAYTRNDGYVSGSYGEPPQIPPIMDPPPAVTKRGPNAPYYDSELTGGCVLRPDARVYNYDNCPSYMRAIIDWSYGRPPGAKNYPKDAEYRRTFQDLCSGNGYKGAFAMDPDPDFKWKPVSKSSSSADTLGAYTSESNVLGAYTNISNVLQRSFDDVENQYRYRATEMESALFDSIKEMLNRHPGQEGIIIDGEVVMLPQSNEASQYIATSNVLRQTLIDPTTQNEEAYRLRLAELGLDSNISI